jgi:hypothetical protein
MKRLRIAAVLVLLTGLILRGWTAQEGLDKNGSGRVQVVFSGGYETDPRDRGRPVVLIAAALGVPPEVFREAFTRVQPAPGGSHPDPEQVRRNKEALMQALGPYGVTNERLDEVSNYYRYNRQRGEMWRNTPARAYAVFKEGKFIKFVVEDAGSGYSSPPTVTVPGVKNVTAGTMLAFSRSFEKNGAIDVVATAVTSPASNKQS